MFRQGLKNRPYVGLIQNFCENLRKKWPLMGLKFQNLLKNSPNYPQHPTGTDFSVLVFFRPYLGLVGVKKGTLTSGTSPYLVLPKYPPWGFPKLNDVTMKKWAYCNRNYLGFDWIFKSLFFYTCTQADGWTDIQRRLEEKYPGSQWFTIVFLFLGHFIFTNLFIGIIIMVCVGFFEWWYKNNWCSGG